MTDYLPYTEEEYAVGAPATSLHFERWFRNPDAIAEGAPGAPKVQGQALKTLLVQAATSQFIVTDLERVSTLLVGGLLWGGASGNSITVNLSSNGGATWGSAIHVFYSVDTNATQRTSQMRAINVTGFNAARFNFPSDSLNNIFCFAIDGVEP